MDVTGAVGPIRIAPARSSYLLAGAGGLAVDTVALAVVASLVSLSPHVLALCAVNAVVSGLVSGAVSRRTLRRVVAPAPDGAVLVGDRLAAGRLLGSALTAVAVVVLSASQALSPAALGAGAGAKVTLLWSARQVGRLERNGGRQLLSVVRRRRGLPALYAAAAA